MKKVVNRFSKYFRNFYAISAVLFVVWMLFFDSNDVISQFKLAKKQAELENAKEFYESKIVEVKNDRSALNNDKDLLEKLAREKYLMKKENEDIYVIVEE
ncbi:MAG: cell division protein DivIC [Marinoscillum sp.]|jgi:cell division protein DivIC